MIELVDQIDASFNGGIVGKVKGGDIFHTNDLANFAFDKPRGCFEGPMGFLFFFFGANLAVKDFGVEEIFGNFNTGNTHKTNLGLDFFDEDVGNFTFNQRFNTRKPGHRLALLFPCLGENEGVVCLKTLELINNDTAFKSVENFFDVFFEAL